MKIISIINMQNGLINSPDAKNALQNTIQWLNKNLTGKDTVFLTVETPWNMNYEEKKEQSIKGARKWQIQPELFELIVSNLKGTFDRNGFVSDRMIWYIKDRICWTPEKIDGIIIAGLYTDTNVISNTFAIKAAIEFQRVPVKILSSCCAGTSIAKHNAAIEVMKSCQIDII